MRAFVYKWCNLTEAQSRVARCDCLWEKVAQRFMNIMHNMFQIQSNNLIKLLYQNSGYCRMLMSSVRLNMFSSRHLVWEQNKHRTDPGKVLQGWRRRLDMLMNRADPLLGPLETCLNAVGLLSSDRTTVCSIKINCISRLQIGMNTSPCVFVDSSCTVGHWQQWSHHAASLS